MGKSQADFKFGPEDFRFTCGDDGALYAYCLTVPAAGTELKIRSLGTNEGLLEKKIQSIRILGSKARVSWRQDPDGLHIVMPPSQKMNIAVGFRIE